MKTLLFADQIYDVTGGLGSPVPFTESPVQGNSSGISFGKILFYVAIAGVVIWGVNEILKATKAANKIMESDENNYYR